MTKTDPTAARAAFKAENGPRETFIKDIAVKHADQLKAAGLSDAEIDAMKKRGTVPEKYNVHHIVALFQGGTNDAANLILLRDTPEHRKITGQQNSAMAGLKIGETRSVDVLYPPKGAVIDRGPSSPGIEHATSPKPTSYAPLKTTEMTSEQIGLYVSIRKEARAIFAETLGKRAPTVSVECNGITSHRERFSTSSGQIVGLADGKLIQQSARGQITAFDYGDLLVNAKDPVAFGLAARQALTTGEPMSLSMQHGQVGMMPVALELQQNLQRGIAGSSLGR